MEKERILKEIAHFLHAYLKDGYVQMDSFSKKIHPNIERFEQLFVLRFLLHDETKRFVEQLPELIRKFKTTSRQIQQTNISEVRGSIDWPETIRTRLNTNYNDRLTFVTNETIRSYDTPENLVLKRLLLILHRELYHNDYVKKFYDATWFGEWKILRRYVDRTLRKNIYLQRVADIPLSRRMIQNTMRHRNPLYGKAASLLARYDRFMRGQFDEEEYEKLLRETFILPKEEDVLFELYWVIQFIKQNTDESTLYLMDGTENVVASWQKDKYEYAIYHDSSGPKDLSFTTYADELIEGENKYAQRLHQSFALGNDYAAHFFGRNKTKVYRRGRPDIIVTARHKETKEINKIIIGEVKHTPDVGYAITGLEEILDYIHLVKCNGDYAYGRIPVTGVLCLGNVEVEASEAGDHIVKVVGMRGEMYKDKLNL